MGFTKNGAVVRLQPGGHLDPVEGQAHLDATYWVVTDDSSGTHVLGLVSADSQREGHPNVENEPCLAVTANANRSKDARSPDGLKPEHQSYWCQYAVDWVTIKDTWQMTVTEQEHDTLVQMLNTCAKRYELAVSHPNQVNPTPAPTSNPALQTPTPA